MNSCLIPSGRIERWLIPSWPSGKVNEAACQYSGFRLALVCLRCTMTIQMTSLREKPKWRSRLRRILESQWNMIERAWLRVRKALLRDWHMPAGKKIKGPLRYLALRIKEGTDLWVQMQVWVPRVTFLALPFSLQLHLRRCQSFPTESNFANSLERKQRPSLAPSAMSAASGVSVVIFTTTIVIRGFWWQVLRLLLEGRVWILLRLEQIPEVWMDGWPKGAVGESESMADAVCLPPPSFH